MCQTDSLNAGFRLGARALTTMQSATGFPPHGRTLAWSPLAILGATPGCLRWITWRVPVFQPAVPKGCRLISCFAVHGVLRKIRFEKPTSGTEEGGARIRKAGPPDDAVMSLYILSVAKQEIGASHRFPRSVGRVVGRRPCIPPKLIEGNRTVDGALTNLGCCDC